jgi:hypothetical protein
MRGWPSRRSTRASDARQLGYVVNGPRVSSGNRETGKNEVFSMFAKAGPGLPNILARAFDPVGRKHQLAGAIMTLRCPIALSLETQ